MAYADKSTDMRRCCISKGGHVIWEGVDIDNHYFLMRNREGFDEPQGIVLLSRKKIDKILYWKKEALKCEEEPTLLLYQDNEDCNWDVKKDYLKKLNNAKADLSGVKGW